jgi:hypothetical protein
MGLNSGEVVVGQIGLSAHGRRMERTAERLSSPSKGDLILTTPCM